MQQLEIQYFYPLTEQLPLDLDYADCDKPKMWTTGNITTGTFLGSTGTYTAWMLPNTIQFNPSNSSVGYWKVGEGLQMHNKKKPNWLHRQMSKIFFGWDWKNN
tara:strand:+ start:226 stop:534 length:309 start_codon:yes stop_codon:yes gene_type:complete